MCERGSSDLVQTSVVSTAWNKKSRRTGRGEGR